MVDKSITVDARLIGCTTNVYAMGYADSTMEFKTDMARMEDMGKLQELRAILTSCYAFRLTIEGLCPPKTKAKKKGAKKKKC